MPLKVKRIFYPAGQGAFYREAFYRDGKNIFNAVYDCGSKTEYGRNNINKCIDNWEGKREVDILFISHFHEDHISNIKNLNEKCHIKNIVAPRLNQKNINILKLSYLVNIDAINLKESTRQYFDILDDLRSLCGKETKIYVINTIGNENYYYESNTYDGAFNPGNIQDLNIIGVDIEKDWKFITYAIENEISYRVIRDIEEKLKININNRIRIEELLDILDDKEKFENLKRLFRATSNNKNRDMSNELSLTLYSGPTGNSYRLANHCFYPNRFPSLEPTSCLYFGDFNAKNNLNELIDFYENNYVSLNDIGILQLPHHGSSGSFNEDLIHRFNNCVYVASAGINSQYKHPNKTVVKKISEENNRVLFVVTEFFYPLIFIYINHNSYFSKDNRYCSFTTIIK